MMKVLSLILCLSLVGCAGETEESTSTSGGDTPEFPIGSGQEPNICSPEEVLAWNYGECYIVVCNGSSIRVENKPAGWWCFNDHETGPTKGSCDGYGQCYDDP